MNNLYCWLDVEILLKDSDFDIFVRIINRDKSSSIIRAQRQRIQFNLKIHSCKLCTFSSNWNLRKRLENIDNIRTVKSNCFFWEKDWLNYYLSDYNLQIFLIFLFCVFSEYFCLSAHSIVCLNCLLSKLRNNWYQSGLYSILSTANKNQVILL